MNIKFAITQRVGEHHQTLRLASPRLARPARQTVNRRAPSSSAALVLSSLFARLSNSSSLRQLVDLQH
ncbi:hypothetical protein E2C01_091608 [Portunus trituberculatus]|uniref:Uncharacterized protein n=1 Tax=Portunus trituberculatus TaxID=210409 RepID=A0A5B7JJG8_PORTR|nr:hypothetical protein [Portunus trituberculatus]